VDTSTSKDEAQMKTQRRQAGFSLIELMVAILILMVIMGAVFTQLDQVQKRTRGEEVRLEMFQTAREFIDQMVRDIHQAGFPNSKLYADIPCTPPNCPEYALDFRNAVGVYYMTPTEVRFQGDVDGDGNVDVVAYKLFPQSGNAGDENCPCLRRAQLKKPVGIAPMAIDLTNEFKTQVENLRIVSADPTDVSKETIFVPYMKDGTPVDLGSYGGSLTKFNFDTHDDGTSLGAASDPINAIWSLRIMLTVQGLRGDIGTGDRPTAFLTATAQVNN
jgi:prepilin-type N-terminal cleavage/methylation domain-containing protein